MGKSTVRRNISTEIINKKNSVHNNNQNIYRNNSHIVINNRNSVKDNYSNNYRLKRMLDSNDRVDYEVVFNLNKKNGEWILVEPGREDLEKIHGLYNYEKN